MSWDAFKDTTTGIEFNQDDLFIRVWVDEEHDSLCIYATRSTDQIEVSVELNPEAMTDVEHARGRCLAERMLAALAEPPLDALSAGVAALEQAVREKTGEG